MLGRAKQIGTSSNPSLLPEAGITAHPAALEGPARGPVGKAEVRKCWHSCSGGLWGVPPPELSTPALRAGAWNGKQALGAREQKLSVSPPIAPLPSLGRRTGLETYRLERVGPDTDLGLTSAQRPEGRGGCVSSHPGQPGLPSTRTASWGNPDGFREMGGPAQVCKQEQHVLFSVPAHPSEVWTPQLLWQQQGWAMAWMTSIY